MGGSDDVELNEEIAPTRNVVSEEVAGEGDAAISRFHQSEVDAMNLFRFSSRMLTTFPSSSLYFKNAGGSHDGSGYGYSTRGGFGNSWLVSDF